MNVFIDPIFRNYYKQFPLVLIDVGARGGLQRNWKPAEKFLQIIGFEPDQSEFNRLSTLTESKPIMYLNTALYKEKTTLDLHLTKNPGVSSIFKSNKTFQSKFPESDGWNIVSTVHLETDTLDHQLREHQVSEVDFIKLDTEGSELFILEGAVATLNNLVFGLEIEVNFAPTRQEQPFFADVDNFVRKLGFQSFDLRPHYAKRISGKNYGGPRGQIIHADVLYLSSIERFENLINQVQDEHLMKARVLKALSICILYGYLDYALEIFETTCSLFTQDEAKLFMKRLKAEFRFENAIPDFPGRETLWDLLYYLFCKPYNRLYVYNGFTSARFLGNLD